MAPPSAAKLYSPRLLSLTTQLADYPLNRAFQYNARLQSRTCGSVIELGLDRSDDGEITDVGMQISACAVGQSSAALMAMSITGCEPYRVKETQSAISRWVTGEGQIPDWPGIEALEPALPFKARHSGLLLPWNAAVEALSSHAGSR